MKQLTAAHLMCECKYLAQTQYKKWRHDKVAQVVHWQPCKTYDLEHADKWYEHSLQKVSDNEKLKYRI